LLKGFINQDEENKMMQKKQPKGFRSSNSKSFYYKIKNTKEIPISNKNLIDAFNKYTKQTYFEIDSQKSQIDST
jgi:hypothetical protein